MNVCDFHTHTPSGCRMELLSSSVELPEQKFVSLEFHPWNLPDIRSIFTDDIAGRLPRFTALGEIGLDRLRGPELSCQRKWLKELLNIAKRCNKPVILHCVRAYPELLALLKNFPLPWAIHGFRGKPELLNEIWQYGGIVSFHPSIINNDHLHLLLAHPAGKIAFETDDDTSVDLDELVAILSKKTGNPDLKNLANNSFMEFVSYGK